MSASKSLMALIVVLLVAGGGVAAAGMAQTDANESMSSVSALEMDAALDNETVMVTLMDGEEPLQNVSVTVEGDEEVTVSTDADGTVVVDRSALTDGDDALAELEIEHESDRVEGKLKFIVDEGSLTLVEEKYEYAVEDEEEEDEEEEDEEEEDEEEEDEKEEDQDEDDEESNEDEADE